MKELNKIKPYTYVVKHKSTGKAYYGSRCKNYTKLNRTPAEDFWKHYTTSSENINNIIEQEGKDAFDYEIRRTFDTVEEMANWETRVLTRSKVLERQDVWMNGNVAGKKILTEAGSKKISETHKDKPKTKEHKQKLRESNIGKIKVVNKPKNIEKQTPKQTAEQTTRCTDHVLKSELKTLVKLKKVNLPKIKVYQCCKNKKMLLRPPKRKIRSY